MSETTTVATAKEEAPRLRGCDTYEGYECIFLRDKKDIEDVVRVLASWGCTALSTSYEYPCHDGYQTVNYDFFHRDPDNLDDVKAYVATMCVHNEWGTRNGEFYVERTTHTMTCMVPRVHAEHFMIGDSEKLCRLPFDLRLWG